jgi:AraC-like DNA-binding protein
MDTIASGSPRTDALAAAIGQLRWTVTSFEHAELAAQQQLAFSSDSPVFHYLPAGNAQITTRDETHRLVAGDFVLLTRATSHSLKAHEDARLFSGRMPLSSGSWLDDRLPPLLVACRLFARDPMVESLLTAMEVEYRAGRPGASTVVDHLANVVAMAAIRAWVENCHAAGEWLVAMRDPNISLALDAIHQEPGSPWTVEALARVARSSRSMFAERFHATVGDPPLRYLARVRMERAMELLENQRLSVAQTAAELGYGSDVAFSRAFRRHTGVSPRGWRDSERRATAS